MAGSIHLIINSAIQQLQEAIDIAAKLQSSLVQLGDHCSESEKESATGLSEEVLQRCRAVVSLLMSSGGSSKTDSILNVEKELIVEVGSPSSSSTNIVGAGHQDPQALLTGGTDEEGDQDHRLATNYERENITETPYIDGYDWRKYGEKKISGSSFTRNYYRCTYSKDRRCKAKKQVQQQKQGFPSLYLVTYQGEHTCRDDGDERQMQLQELNRCIRAFIPSNNNSEGRCIRNVAASSLPNHHQRSTQKLGLRSDTQQQRKER